MKKQAFTLVELIVVITILAILGTIGFISLQGFSSDARDSKRISEIGEIRSGLQIYQARNSLLPTPSEQIVTVGSGSTDLIIQGYAGVSVLNEIRMNGEPKDPLDKEYYTYSVNVSKTKFQLLALLENDNNLISFNNLNIIPTTHASYLNRYPYIVGGGIVGILLDETTNTPLQKLATSVNLSTDTNNYKVIFGNNNQTSTLSGELLYNEIITQTNNNGVSQNNDTTSEPLTAYIESRNACETQTVTVGTYEIASCNVGATSIDPDNTTSRGYLFQWGNARHDTYGVSTTISTTLENTSSCAPNNCKTIDFITNDSYPYDWSDTQNDYLWGGDEPNVSNPTLASQLKKQGVCPDGFHIPTQAEWSSVITTLNVLNDGDLLKNSDLKLPYAGYRDGNSGSYEIAGTNGYYWSSSITSTYAYILFLNLVNVSPSSDFDRAYGLSVRCFKN